MAFIVDSFVSAMTELAEGHRKKQDILNLLENFKRQDASGEYRKKAS
jgi:hypothetical protein